MLYVSININCSTRIEQIINEHVIFRVCCKRHKKSVRFGGKPTVLGSLPAVFDDLPSIFIEKTILNLI
jgi:hypothetical protein